MNIHRVYGCRRDFHDHRDLLLFGGARLQADPSSDLRAGYPEPCPDQGQLGACTAFGTRGVIMFDRAKQGLDIAVPPSCLFQYFNTRDLEDTTDSDSGGSIRDAVKAANAYGLCFEPTWPYDITQFAVKPPDAAYTEGKLHVAMKYQRVVGGVDGIRAALTQGFPVIFGQTCYESFESEEVAQTGIVPMPTGSEQSVGGHCMNICGHDDSKGLFWLRNSWGPTWGQNGYAQEPYDYISQYADDCWVVTLVA